MKVDLYIPELDKSLQDGFDGYVEFEGEVTDYQPQEKPGSVNPGCGEEFEFEITWDRQNFTKEENAIIDTYLRNVHSKLVDKFIEERNKFKAD